MSIHLQRLFFLLGMLSIFYGILVASARSGSRFFLFWFLVGGVLFLPALLHHFDLFHRIPRPILLFFYACVMIGVIFSCICAGSIFRSASKRAPKGLDYLIVLGAHVTNDGPSRSLSYRLDEAAAYLLANTETVCIVSGGKGSNEPASEASVMKQYLTDKGIDENRILLEDRSTNTIENILFSKKILLARQKEDPYSVGIVTNDFHLYRGMSLAKKQGLTNVSGIAARSTLLFLPNNAMREVLGILKDTLMGNM